MIKTTTTPQSQTSSQPKKLKKVQSLAKEFGPSDLTIQNILNYSKALRVMKPSNSETVLGVMN